MQVTTTHVALSALHNRYSHGFAFAGLNPILYFPAMDWWREQKSKSFWFFRQLVNDPIHVISAINDGRHLKRSLWKLIKLEIFFDFLKSVNRKDLLNHLLWQSSRRFDFIKKLQRLGELSLSSLMILGDSLESQLSRLNLKLKHERNRFIIILGVDQASRIKSSKL
jgi:hypothetical protein